jgi:hypothetical protein
MRSLGTRRAVQVTGAATVAVLALAGCSAGQTAETSLLETPVSGLNTASPDGGLLIRNLQVAFGDSAGYPANSTAPIELSLFNQTEQPLTVTISSAAQTTVTSGIVSAQQIGLSGSPAGSSAAPSPSDSAAPADASALQPAKITIDPLGSASFLPGGSQTMQAVGLSNRLAPGSSLALTFQVGTAAPLNVLAPIAIPLSPASRGPAVQGENAEGE